MHPHAPAGEGGVGVNQPSQAALLASPPGVRQTYQPEIEAAFPRQDQKMAVEHAVAGHPDPPPQTVEHVGGERVGKRALATVRLVQVDERRKNDGSRQQPAETRAEPGARPVGETGGFLGIVFRPVARRAQHPPVGRQVAGGYGHGQRGHDGQVVRAAGHAPWRDRRPEKTESGRCRRRTMQEQHARRWLFDKRAPGRQSGRRERGKCQHQEPDPAVGRQRGPQDGKMRAPQFAQE